MFVTVQDVESETEFTLYVWPIVPAQMIDDDD
jgi:hypothetical protein